MVRVANASPSLAAKGISWDFSSLLSLWDICSTDAAVERQLAKGTLGLLLAFAGRWLTDGTTKPDAKAIEMPSTQTRDRVENLIFPVEMQGL